MKDVNLILFKVRRKHMITAMQRRLCQSQLFGVVCSHGAKKNLDKFFLKALNEIRE